jgi:hypothetical protein
MPKFSKFPKSNAKSVIKKPFKKKSTKRVPKKMVASSSVTLTLPNRRSLQMFPDRYVVHGHTMFENSIQLGTAATDSYFQLQIQTNNLSNNYQSMINRSGTLSGVATNAPSGAFYLLGDTNRSSANVGGAAPYYKYRVISQKVTVRWMPASFEATAIDSRVLNAPSAVIINFQNTPLTNTYGMGQSQLIEQPYTKSKYYPPYTTTAPTTVSNKISTLQLAGDHYQATLENGSFDGDYLLGPSQVVFCVVTFVTLGVTTTAYYLNGAYTIDIDQEIEYFDRNGFVSYIPG